MWKRIEGLTGGELVDEGQGLLVVHVAGRVWEWESESGRKNQILRRVVGGMDMDMVWYGMV
jgi:hypothetical protein